MRWWLIPIAALVIPGTVQAQGWIDPPRPLPAFAVHKLRSAVSVHVQDRVAQVEVEEYFRNDGPALGEADYLYPLPGEAVFSNFSLFQGDRELRGEMMDAAQARAIYEQIVRAKRDPALIELAGHGLLRARVFPIAHGETRKITLRYTQVLTRAGDGLQFRYSAGSHDARRAETAPLSFVLTVDNGAGLGEPFSPTQEINVQRTGTRITVRPAAEIRGDFDVVLPLLRGAVGMSLLTYRPASDAGFFMLTLSPGAVAESVVPRDVTAVLDVSGSMSGEKIEQARTALSALLHTLAPADRFRLVAFSDDVRTYSSGWLAASRANVQAAAQWVDALQANGGTNMGAALREAFAASSPAARLPFVIFITDGIPSIGEQRPELLAELARAQRGRARVFAFGVGYDVNTYLLDGLSAAARGSTQYVQPGQNVERPIAQLAARIRFPVLSDLKLADAPVRLTEVYPIDLPDLFNGEDLMIVGRYTGAGRGDVVITGRRAATTERFATSAAFPDHALTNEYIAKIWASRKVGYLSQQIRLHGSTEELLQELRETALRYGVLSEYTSYLVQEPDVRVVAGAPVPPAALAPMASVGQQAVTAAEAGRMKREVRTASAVDAAQRDDAAGNAGATVRTISGRRFELVNGTWTDRSYRNDAGPLVTVEPFSDAYFALLRALPELAPYWKFSSDVQVAGKHIRIRLARDGAAGMSAARIAEIARQFRS